MRQCQLLGIARSSFYHRPQAPPRVNRKRVQRLMRQLGIEAIYPQPRLLQAHPQRQVYPYLLQDLKVTGGNHVWYSDITYLPVLKGHFYLVAMTD